MTERAPRFASFPEAAAASELLLTVANQAATGKCAEAMKAAYDLPSQPDAKHPKGEREQAFGKAIELEWEELRQAERLHADRRAAAAAHFLTPDAIGVTTGGRGDASAQHARDFLFRGITPAGRKLVDKALADWEPAEGSRQ